MSISSTPSAVSAFATVILTSTACPNNVCKVWIADEGKKGWSIDNEGEILHTGFSKCWRWTATMFMPSLT